MGKAEEMVPFANHFLKKGYNVLIPDLRSHGDSDGKYIGMGYLDAKDIRLWIDHIIQINQDAKIILFGRSMGAATVMMTSKDYQNSNIKAIIEDCGYTSIFDQFLYLSNKVLHINNKHLIKSIDFYSRLLAHYSIYDASCIDAIKNCTYPVLFIHGTNDTFVPTDMVYKLYNSCKTQKQLLLINNARHAEAMHKDSKQYFKVIDDWIEIHIK